MSFPSSGLSNKLLKLLTILIPFFLFSCSTSRVTLPSKTKTSTPAIRILLNEPSAKLLIKVYEDGDLISDKNVRIKIRKGDMLNFSEEKGLVLKSGRSVHKANFFIIKSNKSFTFNDRKYSGDMKVISDGKFVYLMNLLDVEEYLKGVIPSEMPLGRGMEYYEALKAFTIVARTYTFQRLADSGKLFDVRTDVRDQVYSGIDRHHVLSNRVVDETRGMLLEYQNQPAMVYYSSTCGGATEDIENVFGNSKIPYLKSVNDGNPPYCSASPRFTWEEKFTGERIISLLNTSGKINTKDYQLSDIKINSRFRSGRINELEILLKHKNGSHPVKLYGNNIRFILLTGRNQTLNSNNFEIIKNGREYIFKGKGWGHGVGLCQWGALIQSTQGKDYSSILRYYFPGTEIKKAYD
jgi:stage II sporulation protein D